MTKDKEINKMTTEELNAKHAERFKEITGMTPDEWIISKYKTITPIELIKVYEVVTEEDESLVGDLQHIGLNDEVINALLEYIFVIYGKGFAESLVLKIGKNWVENGLLTVEKAIEFMKEQDKKKFNI